MVIIDTNIIIDHLRQSSGGDTLLMKLVKKMPKEILCVSLVTIQELYEGESTRDPQKEELLLHTIAPLKILPYTHEIAQYAGEIARDLKNPIEFADAAIAATVVIHNAALYTLNEKHFIGIHTLEFVRV